MSAVVDLLLDATRDAMASAAVQMDAQLFCVDRTVMSRFTVGRMRLYVRDLRKMTPEEIESALAGFDASWWENLPDEVEPLTYSAARIGLNGWLL